MSKYLCFILWGFGLISIQAATPVALDQWVAEALQDHPQISALEAEIKAARAGKQQAHVRPNPELSLEAGFKDAETDNGYAVGAGFMVPIERKGKRSVRLALAENNIVDAELALELFKRELEINIRALGYEYLIASADASIAREIADRSQAMIDQLKQRPAAGPSIFLELKLIEASLVEFQKSGREFSAQQDVARSEMNSLLGRPQDTDLNLSDALAPPTLNIDQEAWLLALENSPALRARQNEQLRTAHEITAASLQAKSDYEVGIFVEREDAGEEESIYGVAFSVPLSRRNSSQGTMAAAQARGMKAEALLEVERRSAASELTRRIRLYKLAMDQLEATPANLISDLHAAADLADRQYRLGTIPVQLFLDLQREFLAIQQIHHAALLSAWQNALALEGIIRTSTETLP